MVVSGQLYVPAASSLGKELPTPGTHWIRGRVGPRAGLDALENRKSLAPDDNGAAIPRPSSPEPVAILTELTSN
jgi:hypothetical protein